MGKPTARQGIEAGVGFALAFGIAEGVSNLVTQYRHDKGIIRDEIPHHFQLGLPFILTGATVYRKEPWGPALLGAGVGLVAHDGKDLIKAVARPHMHPDRSTVKGPKGTTVFFKGNDDQEDRDYMMNPEEPTVQRIEIPSHLSSDDKNRRKLRILKNLVRRDLYDPYHGQWLPAGRDHPEIIEQARQIAFDYEVDGHDGLAVLDAIHDWAQPDQHNIGYVYDPKSYDTFVHPAIALRYRSMDCDDSAPLIASLIEALGHPAGLCVVAQRPLSRSFNHIFAVGLLDERKYGDKVPDKRELRWRGKVLVPMEVTNHPRVPFLYHPRHHRRMVVPIGR